MTQRAVCCRPTLPRWPSLFVLLAAAAIGCAASTPQPGSTGGDVGSPPGVIAPAGSERPGIGVSSTICVRDSQPTAAASSHGVRVADRLAAFRAGVETPERLQWWPMVREATPIPTTLIELTDLHFGDSTGVGCSSFQVPFEFTARTSDAQLRGHFKGQLFVSTFAEPSLQLQAELVDGEFRDGPAHAGLPPDATFTLRLYWHEGEPETLSGSLDAGPLSKPIAWIGAQSMQPWGATPPQPKERIEITVSELQRRACAAVAPTSRATFASEPALRQSLAKIWIACSGSGRVDPDFAGLSIDETGHWHTLRVEGDALVALQGFQNEGQVTRNLVGPDFNLAILDWLPARYEYANAGLSPDGETLRVVAQGADSILDATFQASDLPVRDAQPAYASGVRAGLAACEEGEAEITSRPASEAELRSLLIGRWLFCRGRLGTQRAGIRFEDDDSYRFLEADGGESLDEAGRFSVIDTSALNGPGAYQVNLVTADGNHGRVLALPIFSNAPVKMFGGDEYQSVLSAF